MPQLLLKEGQGELPNIFVNQTWFTKLQSVANPTEPRQASGSTNAFMLPLCRPRWAFCPSNVDLGGTGDASDIFTGGAVGYTFHVASKNVRRLEYLSQVFPTHGWGSFAQPFLHCTVDYVDLVIEDVVCLVLEHR